MSKRYTIHVVNPTPNPAGYPFSGDEKGGVRTEEHVEYRPRIKGRKKRPRLKLSPKEAEALAEQHAEHMAERRAMVGQRYETKSPPRKTKPKRKTTTKPKTTAEQQTLFGDDTMSKSKTKPKRKRRRKNPTPNPAPRRASRSGGGSRRRRRRRNPELVSRSSDAALLPLGMLANEVAPAIIAELVGSALARRFGAAWGQGIFTGSADSAYAGQRWSMSNYAIMIGQGYLVGNMLRRSGRASMAHAYYRGAWEAAMRRFVWTEIIAQNANAVAWFGAPVGMVQDDSYGNRWYATPQGYAAMMGGADGFGDSLVAESPLGDSLVAESPLGHALPGADPIAARSASYRGDGYQDPYHSSYSYQ